MKNYNLLIKVAEAVAYVSLGLIIGIIIGYNSQI